MRGRLVDQARGATPTLTTVKHQISDWIESRIEILKWADGGLSPNPTPLYITGMTRIVGR